MDNKTLLELLEIDKEMTLSGLRADRTPQAAQTTLEKAIDRVALKYAEQSAGADDAAQLMLKTLKSALPFMDSVSEVRRWERTAAASDKPVRLTPMSMALLAIGAVLVVSTMLGLLFTGRRLFSVVALLEAIIPSGLGIAALFFAGLQAGKPTASKPEAPAAREEYLIDPEKVWHHLRGMILLADEALNNIRVRESIREAGPVSGDAPDPRLAELFSSLLEDAYALNSADGREMAEAIRFYLHGVGVDTLDYAQGRESFFEFLPSPKPGTIRPALVSGDRLVKKGLASR